MNRRQRVCVRVRSGRNRWRCEYGEVDWWLLITQPPAEDGERECVCVLRFWLCTIIFYFSFPFPFLSPDLTIPRSSFLVTWSFHDYQTAISLDSYLGHQCAGILLFPFFIRLTLTQLILTPITYLTHSDSPTLTCYLLWLLQPIVLSIKPISHGSCPQGI